MNQRQIGIIILIIGVLLAVFAVVEKNGADAIADRQLEETGTCFTDEGKCLHKQGNTSFLILIILALTLVILGVYLVFFDKTQAMLVEHQVKVSSALQEASKHTGAQEKFNSFLAGFSAEEQLVLKAIHEQDGITQSTLRFRTGMSKASLSLLLNSFEKRELISRKPSGKTKEVFLRKKF